MITRTSGESDLSSPGTTPGGGPLTDRVDELAAGFGGRLGNLVYDEILAASRQPEGARAAVAAAAARARSVHAWLTPAVAARFTQALLSRTEQAMPFGTGEVPLDRRSADVVLRMVLLLAHSEHPGVADVGPRAHLALATVAPPGSPLQVGQLVLARAPAAIPTPDVQARAWQQLLPIIDEWASDDKRTSAYRLLARGTPRERVPHLLEMATMLAGEGSYIAAADVLCQEPLTALALGSLPDGDPALGGVTRAQLDTAWDTLGRAAILTDIEQAYFVGGVRPGPAGRRLADAALARAAVRDPDLYRQLRRCRQVAEGPPKAVGANVVQ